MFKIEHINLGDETKSDISKGTKGKIYNYEESQNIQGNIFKLFNVSSDITKQFPNEVKMKFPNEVSFNCSKKDTILNLINDGINV